MNILLIGDEATRIKFLSGIKERSRLLPARPAEALASLGVRRIYTISGSHTFLYEVDINKTIADDIGNLAKLYDYASTNGVICAFAGSAERKSKFLQSKYHPHIHISIFSPVSAAGKEETILDSLITKINISGSVKLTKATSLDLTSKISLLNPFYGKVSEAKSEVIAAKDENVTFHAVTNRQL